MANFELVLQGFDGSTSNTDHLVLWVAASSRADVDEFITSNNLSDVVRFGSDLPDGCTKENGIDFELPAEAVQLKARIQGLLDTSDRGFDQFQQVVLESYGDHLVQTSVDIPNCGDGLLKFVLTELSEQEDCDSFDCAVQRLDTAIGQLASLRSAFESRSMRPA
ncbi:MAG: hypothetical protein OEL20_04670 [Sulfuritalea sp.]|nr:hypothetical protein [Sulfuritalea sp.]